MSMNNDWPNRKSRRRVIGSVATLCLLGPQFLRHAMADSSCTPDNEQSGLRDSLHYVEASPDRQQKCAGCAFFAAGSDKPCGRCQILNGSVNENGRCDSWSPKST